MVLQRQLLSAVACSGLLSGVPPLLPLPLGSTTRQSRNPLLKQQRLSLSVVTVFFEI